jgi:TolB-like protein/DNA-binding winged helix-turn-helix (wHTH) protein/Tfp pilus assembly protein PilF
MKSHSTLICFNKFEVRLETGELWRYGHRIRIQEKPFQILAILLEHPGDLVTRDELCRRLWPDNTFVDFDHNLNNAVNKLRDALSDSSEKPRLVETVPRRGYRFITAVEVVRNGGEDFQHTKITTIESAGHSKVATEAAALQVATNQTSKKRTPNSARRTVLVFAAVMLPLIVTAVVAREEFNRSFKPAARRTMMLVLPFENLTGDPGQDYFCDGMTEELISQLGNIDPDSLGIIARTTSMHYKGTSKTISEIAGELGVGYVLESSIRRVDHRMRITSQLIQARDQRHLWAQTFDRESSDSLGLQRDVSFAIAEEIPVYLPAVKAANPQSPKPRNSEAYLDCLRGRYFWDKRSKESLDKGVLYFKQAIKEDPQYAPAYAGLADSYLVLGGGYAPPHETYQHGEAAAAEALALDGNLAEAHISLAYFKFIDEWDWDGANREFRRAIALNPGYATAHHWYALYLSGMGRMTESVSEIEKALQLDPLSTVINSNAGAIFYQNGEYEKARAQLQKTLELDPHFSPAIGYLGYIYETKGKYEEALAEYKKAQEASGNPLSYIGDVARIYVKTGRKVEAEDLLRKFPIDSERQSKLSPYTRCLIYASLGDTSKAFKWLAKSIEEREFTATEFSHDLRIENLRGDSRFDQLRRQFNIPDQKLH